MSSLLSLLQTVIYKSSQNRGEDHSGSIILKKDIFIKLIRCLSEEQLTAILIDSELGPVSLEGEEFSRWLEASRRILGLNQTEMGKITEATQAEISRIENNSDKASFSRDRLTAISEKTLAALKALKQNAA
jgi:hypothetical protein